MPCPTCGRPVEWSPGSQWRPFCSERCKLIDLGAWFTEQRSIPGSPAEGQPPDPDQPDEPDRRH